MKQLPGRRRPRWLQQLAGFAAAVIVSIWLVSLLPVLLVIGLVAALLLLPVLRQLRRELERIDAQQSPGSRPASDELRNATPWQQKVRNWMGF
ncbi:hypothetical protein [Synechococcus sp. RS9916]|uniref:hypothetical protein n=1 Tax=Synechococcus sp. RS9916 TaxID=221359 RepID=UPI0000E53E76|nr:hypothetical protein [Synechococcus sp. RS9916]EAU73054.1 hypothetical protein RS9916_26124 [Synechococcus sp. RS9916]